MKIYIYLVFDFHTNKVNVTVALKGNAQFLFLCNPQKSSVNVSLMKIIEEHCHKKKELCVFVDLVKKTLKVTAFETFPISIMVLFEIHQGFKGRFLNELYVSFKLPYLTLKVH